MKIIGISGKKQSGKNTVANFINGKILKENLLIENFNIDEQGLLQVQTANAAGKIGWGILDVTRKDPEFVSYARENIWPLVKVYHFADYLKKICIDLFGLTEEQVYGTDAQKNTMTPYNNMSARDFMQYLGTDVMRSIKNSVWVDYTLKLVQQEQSDLAIIPDVRFPDEVRAIENAGGIVIRLTRDVESSKHFCELALDYDKFNWDSFAAIINNSDCSVKELCTQIEYTDIIWSNI